MDPGAELVPTGDWLLVVQAASADVVTDPMTPIPGPGNVVWFRHFIENP